MKETGEQNELPREKVPGPRSTLYIFGSAVMAALVLGITLFLLVRGFQWRGALADLRAEPGIEILSIERVGFFKKRLLGLRDPLAPTAESILIKNNIGPNSAEVVLTEYHSLNTPYAVAREKEEQKRFDDLRQSVLSAIGEFASTTSAKREADLERITQMLFQARFPDAMKTVHLEWKNGKWLAKGELCAPQHKTFLADSPDYIVDGELDFGGLVNLTESRTSSIRQDLESTDLFTVDLDGKYVHIERMRRLVADYDQVCQQSGLPQARLQLEITVTDPATAKERSEALKHGLTAPGGIAANRFLFDLIVKSSEDSPPKAHLKLISVVAR
ncbi:MAG TPA: hypothetical protein PK648_04095 [Verrucomicrobiales bacterium]|jgi:hypothetical protein|nr:hypothetical protein [Verrucomicrobiales bacterium]